MTNAFRRKELHRALITNGFKPDRSETSGFRYTGAVVAGGRSVSIAITFWDLEFTRLPTVDLLKIGQEAQNVVAHLRLSGDFCFARNEDIVLDRYNVAETVLQCIQLATQALERVLTQKKRLLQEIATEFPQHWQGKSVLVDLPRNHSGRAMLYAFSRTSGTTCSLLTAKPTGLRRFGIANVQAVADAGAIACILPTSNTLTFDAESRPPKTLEEFLVWIERSGIGNRRSVLQELARPYPEVAAFFINASNGCVGISIDTGSKVLRAAQRSSGLVRLLAGISHETKVQRYSGQRVDSQFLLTRNLNNKSPLVRKRIAVIGCGTIGSHLAKFLVQSGAGYEDGTLMLVDNQEMEPGNIGRHYLGLPSIGLPKAMALRAELLRSYPDANIHCQHAEAIGYLGNIASYDLVIDATGEEALSFALNDHLVRLRAKQLSPALLRIWLIGNGDAAQALLVDGFDFACLKCLRPDQEQPWRHSPMRSVNEATITAAACGEGAYIAYGVAAPVIAAALALELAMDWNHGDPAPRLRTLCINNSTTIAVKNKNATRAENCPACATIQRPEKS